MLSRKNRKLNPVAMSRGGVSFGPESVRLRPMARKSVVKQVAAKKVLKPSKNGLVLPLSAPGLRCFLTRGQVVGFVPTLQLG